MKAGFTSARASLVSSWRWVGVTARRRGDQEREVGRAVLGAEVDLGVQPREGERRLLDAGRAAVGDRDAAGEPGR